MTYSGLGRANGACFSRIGVKGAPSQNPPNPEKNILTPLCPALTHVSRLLVLLSMYLVR